MKSLISNFSSFLWGETKHLIVLNIKIDQLKIMNDGDLYRPIAHQEGDDIIIKWKVNNPILYIILGPIYMIAGGSIGAAIHPGFDPNISLVFLLIAFASSRAVIQIYKPDRIQIQLRSDENREPSVSSSE